MKTNNLKRCPSRKIALALFGCFALAALSPAPINTSSARRGVERERTEEQRALDQQHVQIDEVGLTPGSTNTHDAPAIEGDGSGDTTVRDASIRGEEAINTASESIKHKDSSPLKWLWGLLAVGGALGSVQIFKSWANKHLPDAPTNL